MAGSITVRGTQGCEAGAVVVSWWVFFFSSRRRHTRFDCDWSSDVCSSDLEVRGLELRALAVTEDGVDDGVLLPQRLQHAGVRGEPGLRALRRLQCELLVEDPDRKSVV